MYRYAKNVYSIQNDSYKLKNDELITISKNSNLSIISITDTTKLFQVIINNLQIISFKEWIEKLIKQI
jgi:hypothetical protein